MTSAGSDVVGELRREGVGRGDLVALTVAPGVGLGLAVGPGRPPVAVEARDPARVVGAVEDALGPRWVVWSGDTASVLVRAGVRVATCWDVAAVGRLLFGGWRAEPARVWARLHDLPPETAPVAGTLDLFGPAGDAAGPDDAVRGDGHLGADWAAGGWAASPERLGRWAGLALTAAVLQQDRLGELRDRPMVGATARSESTVELLCAELSTDGLPLDRAAAEAIVAGHVGPRPRRPAEAAAQRARRDAEVLRHAPPGIETDLRSPGQVKALLHRVGVDVPDTRAWRLEAVRDAHPLVAALLAWRKAERVGTTYGYPWLDEHLGRDGRLRGAWSGADGAAGRMTASAGLHNMPADMRRAVVAEAGHVFVRADLGQVEPRVLAAVSADAALAQATGDEDMYAPVARQLGVDRETAKVAVLGAMYGQTTGHGAQALRRLRATYPVAMAYLDDADRAARAGHDLRTYGGRLVRMGPTVADGRSERDTAERAAARGRYGRNALVQGAAAELFKHWALTVRARVRPLGARIVLCLHDELLVHAPADRGEDVARLLADALAEATHRWAPDHAVRFVADIAVVHRWSDAKTPKHPPAS